MTALWRCDDCGQGYPCECHMERDGQVSAMPEREIADLEWPAAANISFDVVMVEGKRFVPEQRALDAESRLREVEAEAREADILLAGQIRELTRLRAERDALVPFAKHGLHLAANWYAPHFAARAILDRLDREAK